ncbi:MAG: zinc-ribbon domain-containing protein [Myxococcales bacterium]|nr:zinc-ribbon domain-containing protein [Myxococcales bacterium]
MDVRCEKCQTEYELDEARLKPGGVTVKCTTCGHMFKIRTRTITNVGTPVPRDQKETGRHRPSSPAVATVPAGRQRADSIFEDDSRGDEAPTTIERQWLIRLENGEQKTCRELATLQQWIISSVVTRESLISRTGKTWKRLGDVADLGQYFTIADEARANRERHKPTRPVPPKDLPSMTLPGYGGAAQAAGGTILPDDDDDDDDDIEPPTTRRPRSSASG